MNYKDNLYKNYVSTHVAPQKGAATLALLKSRAILWRRTFGRFLPRDKKAQIIDLGCGHGSIVWWLQQSGFANACGIDISAEQIEAGAKCGVTGIERADIKEFLRDKKGFYDTIFARDVIEHFEKPEILEVLSQCCQSLKPGGVMVIQAPNAGSPFLGRLRYGDFTHEIAFTTSSLSQVLRAVGFGEMRFYPSGPSLWFSPGPAARFVLWKMVEAFYKFLLFVETGDGKKIVTENIIAVAVKN